MDDAQLMQMLQEQYPQYYALLQYDPQILDIFRQVADKPAEWPQARIDAAIAATPWWQDTPAGTRQLIALNVADPATARERISDNAFTIRQLASRLGIQLTDEQVSGLAIHAVASQWDEAQLRVALFALPTGENWRNPGQLSQTIAQYNALADQYGVPLDLYTLNGWAANTLNGMQTQEGFESFVRQQATNLYPALASAIASGQTVAQYAAPYFQLAAQELGINPNSIRIRDPKWMDLVLGTDDKGQQGVNSMSEALIRLRSDPAYGYDMRLPARQQSAQFASTLLKQFGAMG